MLIRNLHWLEMLNLFLSTLSLVYILTTLFFLKFIHMGYLKIRYFFHGWKNPQVDFWSFVYHESYIESYMCWEICESKIFWTWIIVVYDESWNYLEKKIIWLNWQKWHPDRCSASGNVKFVEEAKKKFQAIQEAYSGNLHAFFNLILFSLLNIVPWTMIH